MHVISPHSDTRDSAEGWDGALSKIRRAVGGKDFDVRYFFTSGTKCVLNQSENID